VAEDNTINQKLMRKSLAYYGYTPDIVANGYEVLEALERQTYDLIFMDIQMPEMDGLEATRQIVSKYSNTRPRIVAMTASALGADRENCLNAGMDDYTSKPIKIEVIEKMIVKWNPNAKKFTS
jgi:CheY-like chemotaxis protein